MRSALRMAWRELLAHPWRSLAAASGVIVATAAAVAGASLAAGAERDPLAAAAAQGHGPLVLAAGSERSGVARASLLAASFDADDVVALQREIAGIERLAPATSLLGLAATAPSNAHRALLLGTTPDYFVLTDQPLASGRWMTGEELVAGAPVCVVGPALAADLFGSADPLQGTVRVGTMTCPIIGVLAARATSAAPDGDDLLAMPLATFQRGLLGTPTISAIYFSTRADHSPLVVAHQVDLLMRERRRLAPNAVPDFSLRAARVLLPAPASAVEHLPVALAGAAGAGFFLGGLGILLALRASVAERRRQIGICLALGASRRAVALHLTLEATLLSTLGGLLGAALGLLLGYAGDRLGGLEFRVPTQPLLCALVASVFVGIAFGALVARAAAQGSPADLRRQS